MKIKNQEISEIQDKDINNGTFIIDSSVKIIGADAFNYCYSLQKIIIPKNIEKINRAAFSMCDNLNEVIFENPECEANGIITCDKCNNKIKWECNGKNTITKLYT